MFDTWLRLDIFRLTTGNTYRSGSQPLLVRPGHVGTGGDGGGAAVWALEG